MNLPPEIFKAYDIRGVVGGRHACDRRAIGQALGSRAQNGRDTLVVGATDGTGPELSLLSDGIRAAGANVIDVGMVATPMTTPPITRHAVERDGHRQPQSARLQRPQDGHRGQHTLRRRHPGDT
jgi:phosphomannomutase